jgi:hypothetical protein
LSSIEKLNGTEENERRCMKMEHREKMKEKIRKVEEEK